MIELSKWAYRWCLNFLLLCYDTMNQEMYQQETLTELLVPAGPSSWWNSEGTVAGRLRAHIFMNKGQRKHPGSGVCLLKPQSLHQLCTFSNKITPSIFQFHLIKNKYSNIWACEGLALSNPQDNKNLSFNIVNSILYFIQTVYAVSGV